MSSTMNTAYNTGDIIPPGTIRIVGGGQYFIRVIDDYGRGSPASSPGKDAAMIVAASHLGPTIGEFAEALAEFAAALKKCSIELALLRVADLRRLMTMRPRMIAGPRSIALEPARRTSSRRRSVRHGAYLRNFYKAVARCPRCAKGMTTAMAARGRGASHRGSRSMRRVGRSAPACSPRLRHAAKAAA